MKNTVKIDPQSIPDHVMEMLCRPLVGLIEEFYQDPANVAPYIEWHKRKYGRLPSNIDNLNAVLEAGVSL
ncbi:MAG: hypothetical protein FWB87_13725 [Defluviitaleaceae bacterium]|nr:hypothetical protein [Defluviitaleaceae bacterium]